MAVQGARERISRAVLGWGHVTQHPHRFGGTEYRLGRRERSYELAVAHGSGKEEA